MLNIAKRGLAWCRRETVLVIALALAAASAFLVPPDAEYGGYIDWGVLAMLYCLMAVVAGLTRAGLFQTMRVWLLRTVRSTRSLAAVMAATCFFSAALITNDVALITFVPFTLELLAGQKEKRTILIVTCLTVAANLGSLLTPIGNPQNLFLYSYYHMGIGDFFAVTAPLAAVSACLTALLLPLSGNERLSIPAHEEIPRPERAGSLLYGALFCVTILTVLGFIPRPACFAAVTAAALLKDRTLLREIDYSLLTTFACFFVFVGNAGRVPAVHAAVTQVLGGRECLTSAALSQIISNVPAATMLAPFTDDAAGLIRGTNIGGLGTLIASMASLISYRAYSRRPEARRGQYIGIFTLINAVLLAVMLGIFCGLPIFR